MTLIAIITNPRPPFEQNHDIPPQVQLYLLQLRPIRGLLQYNTYCLELRASNEIFSDSSKKVCSDPIQESWKLKFDPWFCDSGEFMQEFTVVERCYLSFIV